jgi:hypothetical protein
MAAEAPANVRTVRTSVRAKASIAGVDRGRRSRASIDASLGRKVCAN